MDRPGRRGARIAALAACGACLAFAAPAVAETITVNVGDDVTDANDGDCTLREAFTAANNNAASGPAVDECEAGEPAATERDVIDFDLGAGNHVIALTGTELPALTDQVEIDGRNGTLIPRIELNGAVLGAGSEGIFLTTGSEGSYVHDIAVNNFTSDGVNLFSGDHLIERVISGTDLAGTASTLGNGGFGIDVVGDNNTLDQVVSSANDSYGVNVDFRADGTTITGSRIGTTKAGTADLGNGSSGIQIGASTTEAAGNTTIGGSTGLTPGGACTGDCNVISGNTIDGVMALGADEFGITGLTIRGNHIGTDLAGTAGLGNSRGGIFLAGNVPGALVRENVIAGNSATGVNVGPWTSPTATIAPSGTAIEANRIGVTTAGSAPLANGSSGVLVVSDTSSGFDPVTGTVVGGTTGLTPGGACTGDCNVISGNTQFGVSLFGAVDGTQVLGNHIGTDVAGTGDVGNTQAGVSIGDVANVQIGSPGAGNVISGNATRGVQISEGEAGTEVQANLIGAATDGADLGNDSAGVTLSSGSSGTLVGGIAAGEGNTIAANGEAGVEVAGGAAAGLDNAILGNSIVGNADLGIDLGAILGGADGPTANDGTGDADTGGNGLQNFPDLRAAVGGGSTFVAGELRSSASDDFRVEVFANASGDQGETLLGSFELTTDSSGVATFARELAGTAGAGDQVTATATELDGGGDPLGTSELSAAITEGCDNTPTAGADTVVGTSGDDVLCGLGGGDTFRPGGGDDVVVGGTGDDELDLSALGSAADLDLDAAQGTVGSGTLAVFEVEDVTGTDRADYLTGDAAANNLDGGAGNDSLVGDGGADKLTGADGADSLKGSDGGDVASGGDGKDELKGQDGADTLKGQDARDELTAGDGADTLKGGGGRRDDLEGGKGRDALNGGGGSKDVCDGGPSRDKRSAPGCETERSIP